MTSVQAKKKTQSEPHRSSTGWDLFKTRDFALLWASQAISQVGDGLIKVALLWFVYKLTGSALKMTVIGLLQTIPPLLLSPVIGVYLDRLPKKPIMIATEILRAALLVLIPFLHSMQFLSLAGLYLLVFLTSVVFTAFGPSLSASVPLIVNRSHLTAANALIQSTATMGIILGPVISGPGMSVIGAENMLYVGAPAFLVAAGLLMPIRIRESKKSGGRAGFHKLVDDMLAGLTYAWNQQRAVRQILIVTALHSVVASAFVFLLPVYADQSLNAGPVELGWLWSAYGGGMLIAAVWLTIARQPLVDKRVWTVSIVLACGSLAAGGLAWLHVLSFALPFNAIIGISLGMVTPVTWSLLQEWVPEHFRGRVFAMVSTVAMSASLIGMMAFGWSSERFGPQVSLMGMAVVLMATSVSALLVKSRAPKERSRRVKRSS